MTSSKISLGAINMTAENPQAQATFWSAVTGNEISGGGDSFYLAPNGPDGWVCKFNGVTPNQEIINEHQKHYGGSTRQGTPRGTNGQEVRAQRL